MTTPSPCPECGSKHFAIPDELQPDGKFAPGNLRRCVECKTVYNPASPCPAEPPSPFDLHAAEQFRARLMRLEDRVSNMSEPTGRPLVSFLQRVAELPADTQRDLWLAMVEELAPPRWMTE